MNGDNETHKLTRQVQIRPPPIKIELRNDTHWLGELRCRQCTLDNTKYHAIKKTAAGMEASIVMWTP